MKSNLQVRVDANRAIERAGQLASSRRMWVLECRGTTVVTIAELVQMFKNSYYLG